jgi:hypothetical protein
LRLGSIAADENLSLHDAAWQDIRLLDRLSRDAAWHWSTGKLPRSATRPIP